MYLQCARTQHLHFACDFLCDSRLHAVCDCVSERTFVYSVCEQIKMIISLLLEPVNEYNICFHITLLMPLLFAVRIFVFIVPYKYPHWIGFKKKKKPLFIYYLLLCRCLPHFVDYFFVHTFISCRICLKFYIVSYLRMPTCMQTSKRITACDLLC